MQDNGPLIALIFFVLASGWFGWLAYERQQALEGSDPSGEATGTSTHKDVEIEDAKDEVLQLENDVAVLQGQIKDWRIQIEMQQKRMEYLKTLGDQYLRGHKVRLKLKDAGTKFKAHATKLGGDIDEAKQKTERNINKDESVVRESSEQQIRDLQQQMEASGLRIAEAQKLHQQDKKAFTDQKSYENTGLVEFKRQLDLLTQRDVVHGNLVSEIDGSVLLSDPVNNTIIINRGTSHGVKNGYRFEVFSMAPGNQKVHKAYIEVRNAKASMSDCQIMKKVVSLPRDPLSGYVAAQPEEVYSPNAQSGKEGNRAQRLVAEPKTVVTGMSLDAPILKGDYIQNPFYNASGKTYTFYIAAEDKNVAHGRQKSAIAYTVDDIERVVTAHGSSIVPHVDLKVDFVIAQKNFEEDLEFLKVRELGIPVVYEWELFRFLDQR